MKRGMCLMIVSALLGGLPAYAAKRPTIVLIMADDKEECVTRNCQTTGKTCGFRWV